MQQLYMLALSFLVGTAAGFRHGRPVPWRWNPLAASARESAPAVPTSSKIITTMPGSDLPELPGNALVIRSTDEATWQLEQKEYKSIQTDGTAPNVFAPWLKSFELKGEYFHAFENVGQPLRTLDFVTMMKRDDGMSSLPPVVADALRITLIRDLMDAVNWCHLQGLPYLSLDSDCVRVYREKPAPGKRRGLWRLAVVGVGAGPQIASRGSPFQINNETWPFNPPETLSGALLQGNLPGFFVWDSWSVGVLLSMICGGYNESPFLASAKLQDFTFSTQSAVSKQIKKTFSDLSPFLSKLNEDSSGFVFRHGWLIEVLVGLLKPNPNERMALVAAWEIMSAAAGKRDSAKLKPGTDATTAFAGLSANEIIQSLGQERTKQLRAAFDEFDTDGSGDISVDEIVLAMAKVGTTVSLDQAAKLVAAGDQDGDGNIDFDEFVVMMKDMDKSTQPTAFATFGSRLTSTEGEPFRSLESMISIADKGLCEVVIQNRTKAPTGDKEGSTLRNYGEIVGFRNRADGDRWDILVPGLDQQLPVDSRHRLSAVLGVVMVKGGNHKLVVSVGGKRPDPAVVSADIKTFMEEYAKTHDNVRSGRRMRYLELDDPFDRPAGLLDTSSLLGLVGGDKTPKANTKDTTAANGSQDWLGDSFL